VDDELRKLKQPLSGYDINNIDDEIKDKVKLYKLLIDTMIPQHIRIIGENKDKINELEGAVSTVTKPKDVKNLKYKQDKLRKENERLENYISINKRDAEDLLSEINHLNKLMNENNELIDNFKNVEFSIIEKNKKTLEEYSNNIRILNEGKINISQQPDESEDEYLRRLDDIADEEYDDTEIEEKAYIANINEFKQNMKLILSTEWKVENILKSLTREEVFESNKTFPAFQKNILETFGRNNTNVSESEYIEMIKLHLYGNDTSLQDKVKEGVMVEPQDEVEASKVKPVKFSRFEDHDNGITFQLTANGTVLIVENIQNNKQVFLSLGKREGRSRRVMYRYQLSDDETPLKRQNRSETFLSNFKKVFVDYLEMSEEQVDAEFRGKIDEKTVSSFLVKQLGLQEPEIKGTGIKELKTKVPPIFVFGKVHLLLDKLYYKNVLAIKDKNMQNIQGLSNKRVSNEFVDLIMKIIDDVVETTKDDLYSLDEKEQELYNILMYKSGFYKEGKTKLDTKNVIKRLKSRLALVEGEIKAGNDNTDNFKELYSILFKLCNLGAVSLSEGRKYYKEIVKQYS
jgi:hypothetical protein